MIKFLHLQMKMKPSSTLGDFSSTHMTMVSVVVLRNFQFTTLKRKQGTMSLVDFVIDNVENM